MNRCPFCGQMTVGKIKLPNNQHIVLQTGDANGNIHIGPGGIDAELIGCSSCGNFWFHNDSLRPIKNN